MRIKEKREMTTQSELLSMILAIVLLVTAIFTDDYVILIIGIIGFFIVSLCIYKRTRLSWYLAMVFFITCIVINVAIVAFGKCDLTLALVQIAIYGAIAFLLSRKEIRLLYKVYL